jgi:hypothetical protein
VKLRYSAGAGRADLLTVPELGGLVGEGGLPPMER